MTIKATKTTGRYTVQLIREGSVSYEEAHQITNPEDVAGFLRKINLDKNPQEIVMVLYLDTKNKVIGYEEISRGSLNSGIVEIASVFRGAILACANSVIFAHNHPSGSAKPSADDVHATNKISEAGKLIGIKLLDSLVLGDTVYSFRQEGLLN